MAIDAFDVVLFRHKKDNEPRRESWTVAQLELALSRHVERAAKDGPLWSPTEYPAGATRAKESVTSVSCLVLDFDDGLDHEDLVDRWRGMGYRFFVHSSHSHTAEFPKWRAAFPLETPVPAEEWPEAYAGLVRLVADGLTDPSCKDASRIYYLPACRKGAPRFAESVEGRPLRPDEGLPYVPTPGALPERRAPKPRPEGVESPGDWYERNGDWADVLSAAGGKFQRMAGRRQHWLRPGKPDDGDPSATTGNGYSGQDLLKVHTSNWGPFEGGEVMTKYGAYTLVFHGRDQWTAAIAAIKAMPGYPKDEGGSSRERKPLPPGPPLGIPDGMGPSLPADAPRAEVVDEDPPDGKYHDPRGFWRRFAIGDVGNAERFVQAFGRDLRYVAGDGWYVYDSGIWKKGDEGIVAVKRQAMRLADVVMQAGVNARDDKEKDRLYALGATLRNKRALDPMLGLASAFPEVEARRADFDASPYDLGVRNGVVDMRTGELRAASPDDMITMRCGCEYRESPAPHFLAFLEQIMLGREELMRFLMLSLGYSLSGSISTRAFWFLTGTGGNGKGALLRLMGRIAADYATTLMTESVMVKKNEQIPADIAKLHGKRFVSVGEVNDEKRLNEPLIKTLSGFDEISARFLNQNFFDFTPCAKIWLAGNQRPQVRNFDRALRQRMRVVPFELDLPVEQQDGHLHEKLWDEAQGVLWLVVRAFMEFDARGLPQAEAIEEATDAYQSSTDSVSQFLDSECDTSDEHARSARPLIWRGYVAWCRDNRAPQLGKQKFYARLGTLGVKTSDTVLHGSPVFVGVRLLGESDYSEENED